MSASSAESTYATCSTELLALSLDRRAFQSSLEVRGRRMARHFSGRAHPVPRAVCATTLRRLLHHVLGAMAPVSWRPAPIAIDNCQGGPPFDEGDATCQMA